MNEKTPSRWAGFDPAELETIRTAVAAHHRAKTAEPSHNDSEISRLDRIWNELYDEINSREGFAPPEAGPEEPSLCERLATLADELDAVVKRLSEEGR